MFKNIFSGIAIGRVCHDGEPMQYSPRHKQDTRERIVNSARRLFNRKGF
jgi:hypothetical protein